MEVKDGHLGCAPKPSVSLERDFRSSFLRFVRNLFVVTTSNSHNPLVVGDEPSRRRLYEVGCSVGNGRCGPLQPPSA
jgi:hypothetical protein